MHHSYPGGEVEVKGMVVLITFPSFSNSAGRGQILLSDAACDAVFSRGYKVRLGSDIYEEL